MKRQLLAALCAFVSSTLIAAERPNVLLIVADDLGWADVGWHGGFGRTPHMDRLVREGRELDRHYVQPVCTPTRAALMSGRCPGRFGPQALSASNLRAMPLGTLTFASALKSVGYRTQMSGAEGNATELVAAEALNRISHGGDQPWFVYVPFHAVHTPVDAPEQYKRIYDGVRFHDDAVKHESRLRMAAMVAQLDAKIGEFVAALERTGQRERTLIIFTSDNGGAESRRNVYVGTVPHSPYNSDNAPLRGQKDSLYEGGIRVCAFANWPGRLSPGKVTAPLYVGDWLPTVAGLVGLEPAADPGWDGLDRWEVVSGANATPPPRTIYIAHPSGQALLHGDWKIIRTKGAAPQLFDLAQDPYEREDLAGGQPEKLGEMIGRLDAQLAKDDPHLAADLVGLPP